MGKDASRNSPAFSLKTYNDIRDIEIPKLQSFIEQADRFHADAVRSNNITGAATLATQIGTFMDAQEGWRRALKHVDDTLAAAKAGSLVKASGLMPAELIARAKASDEDAAAATAALKSEITSKTAAWQTASLALKACADYWGTGDYGRQVCAPQQAAADSALFALRSKEAELSRLEQNAKSDRNAYNTISFTGGGRLAGTMVGVWMMKVAIRVWIEPSAGTCVVMNLFFRGLAFPVLTFTCYTSLGQQYVYERVTGSSSSSTSGSVAQTVNNNGVY